MPSPNDACVHPPTNCLSGRFFAVSESCILFSRSCDIKDLLVSPLLVQSRKSWGWFAPLSRWEMGEKTSQSFWKHLLNNIQSFCSGGSKKVLFSTRKRNKTFNLFSLLEKKKRRKSQKTLHSNSVIVWQVTLIFQIIAQRQHNAEGNVVHWYEHQCSGSS